MFHQQEGRGRGKFRPDRPENLEDVHGPHVRKHHDDGEPGPGFGHRGPRMGRPHLPGRGFGWMPRDFLFGPGRGPVARRGDVRAAILVLLAEEPMHGYQIIQQLGDRSGGMWRPSAGSVYPTLQQLEDEGLVKGEDRDGRNVFSLTDEGRKAADEAAKNRAPWEMAGATEAVRLFDLFMPLGEAVKQVSAVGSPETIARARTILIDARKALYRLLAEDEPAESPDDK